MWFCWICVMSVAVTWPLLASYKRERLFEAFACAEIRQAKACTLTRQLKTATLTLHACITPAYHSGDIAVDGKGLCRLLVAVHSFIHVGRPIFGDGISKPQIPHPILLPSNELVAWHREISFFWCMVQIWLLIQERLWH